MRKFIYNESTGYVLYELCGDNKVEESELGSADHKIVEADIAETVHKSELTVVDGIVTISNARNLEASADESE